MDHTCRRRLEGRIFHLFSRILWHFHFTGSVNLTSSAEAGVVWESSFLSMSAPVELAMERNLKGSSKCHISPENLCVTQLAGPGNGPCPWHLQMVRLLTIPPFENALYQLFYLLQRGARAGQVCLFSLAFSVPGQRCEGLGSFCNLDVSLEYRIFWLNVLKSHLHGGGKRKGNRFKCTQTSYCRRAVHTRVSAHTPDKGSQNRILGLFH